MGSDPLAEVLHDEFRHGDTFATCDKRQAYEDLAARLRGRGLALVAPMTDAETRFFADHAVGPWTDPRQNLNINVTALRRLLQDIRTEAAMAERQEANR